MEKINILGINISTAGKEKTIKKISDFLIGGKLRRIVTPNPEIILCAQKDEEYFYILNTADLAIPDGMGLKLAGYFLKKNLKRIAGSELLKDILKLAQENKKRVVIFNWQKGLSKKEEIRRKLKELYPNLNFAVEDIKRNSSILSGSEISRFKPEIAIVALGAPWQDKFAYHELPKLPSVKLGIGVGGSFDYLVGKIKEPPKLFRRLGLEWFWRLVNIFQYTDKKKRLKRIYSAVAIFPWKFFLWRFVFPFLYRPNVACLLFKKEKGNFKILIVERSDEDGHWQLPQGGLDKKEICLAGRQELKEEISCDNFKDIKVFKNLYKYDFFEEIASSKHRGGDYQKHTGYKGQKQNLFIAEYLGAGDEIKINFWDHRDWKWVDSRELVEEVHPIRKRAAKIYLQKFNELIKKNEI